MKKKGQRSRKEAIVKAAIECFAKNGVAQTTMSQIAEKAKVDQPLIYYHFPTSQALHVEVFQFALESLKEESLKALESKKQMFSLEALLRYARAPFVWAKKEPELTSIWMYFYYLASFDPTFRDMNQKIRQMGRERILVILYQGLEKGE